MTPEPEPEPEPGPALNITLTLTSLLVSLQLQRQPQQRFEIRHSKTRDRIPPRRRVPARVGDDTPTYDGETGLAIDAITADAPAGCYVRKACVGDCIY